MGKRRKGRGDRGEGKKEGEREGEGEEGGAEGGGEGEFSVPYRPGEYGTVRTKF